MTDTALKSSNLDLQKGRSGVAALLLAMGKPLASKVLQYFDEDEVRQIAETTATLGAVPRQLVDGLVEEVEKAVRAGADILGNSVEAQQLLSGVVPPEKLAGMLASLRKEDEPTAWVRLNELSSPAISERLLKEHPQVVAFVLSKAGAGVSATVLRQAPANMRSEIVRRILAMRPVTDTASGILEAGVRAGLLAKSTTENVPPVHARVASIMNKMDRRQIDELLTDLESRRPKDAKLVKGKLFDFDDIAKLSPVDRVKLFDGASVEHIILALHKADMDLREMVLASVSQRSRRMIEQELSAGANPPPREIDKAKRAIADMALDMAERGVIAIDQQNSSDKGAG